MATSTASVSFPAAGVFEGVVTGLRVVQEEYKHDIAIVTVPMAAPSRRHYRSDTPVTITWRQGRDAATFTGVVHHVEPSPAASSSTVEVWCRGASEVFDNGLQQTWVNRTVPSVLNELARDYRFDADITPHGQVFDAMHADGGRTWDFMVARAKTIGYSLYAKNTRLLMHPRTAMVDKYASQAPVLRRGTQSDSGTLYEFAPVDGAAPPGKVRAATTLYGTNSRTGMSFATTGGPMEARLARTTALPRGQISLASQVTTPEEGRWHLAAMAENDRFNITATAVGLGNPRVHQTWPVLLSNVDDNYIGLWFVKKVTHILNQREYFMELDLGRDGIGSTVTIPDARARRVVATRANPQGRPKSAYPPTLMVNGQWRSQWSTASRVSKS